MNMFSFKKKNFHSNINSKIRDFVTRFRFTFLPFAIFALALHYRATKKNL